MLLSSSVRKRATVLKLTTAYPSLYYYSFPCFEQIATPTPIVAIQITENHPVCVKI